jgi:UrcA family protein
MKTITLTIALAAAALAVTPALAGEAKLGWKDLDLATDAGKAELDRRIETVAVQACAPKTSTGTILTQRTNASCLEQARQAIKAQVSAKIAANGSKHQLAEAH